MTAFADNIWFETVNLGCCGFICAFPKDWIAQRRRDHNDFWCPNCKSTRYWPQKSDLQLANERAEAERKKAQQALESKNRAIQQRDAAAKQYAKLRDRVKNGVCPCCNRTFQNLLNHLRTKHKNFGTGETLRALRQAYGMTQQALADEIGIYPMAISGYELNKRIPEHVQSAIESWLAEQAA